MFNNEYTNYWKNTVDASVDGCKVADGKILEKCLKFLKIQKTDKLLDLGCSYGRMFETINKFTDFIYGIDVDLDTINEASIQNYVSLNVAYSDNTTYPKKFFHKIVSWGVFDVVNQEQSLLECNRILKHGGRLLFTGKNSNYCTCDDKAFIAERNAKLKSFPHKFTNLEYLISVVHLFGFKVIELFIATKRGDMGSDNLIRYTKKNSQQFYEFVLILEKNVDISISPNIIFTQEFSEVAKAKAKENEFDNIIEYFKHNKDVNGQQ